MHYNSIYSQLFNFNPRYRFEKSENIYERGRNGALAILFCDIIFLKKSYYLTKSINYTPMIG